MKNLLLLIILFSLNCSAFAQRKLLSQPYQSLKSQATISDFLDELNLRSGIIFEYSLNNIDTNKLIQLKGEENTIGNLLQTVLEGQLIKLLEHNSKIILVPSTEPFSIQQFLPVRYSVFGYIREADSREPLTDATIYEPSTQQGTISNNYGYFNMLLTEGKHKIEISYTGLDPVTLELNVRGNIRKDVSLMINKQSYSTVVVQSEAAAKDGSIKVSDDQTYSNILMGEPDPVRTSCLSPGMQNVSSSINGFFVRGGGTDENLFLLDGNPVYNPTHLLGALSIINQTALKTLRLYKSDFPARFSGSLSSVLDVYTKDGNMQAWHGEVNAGLLAGSFTLEGPLAKNKTAVMISARKNISVPFYKSIENGTSAKFYDMHFRMTNILNSKNKLAFNFYKGQDRLSHTGTDINNLHKWGNMVGSVGWNYIVGSRSFVNTSVNFSEYTNLGGFQYTLYQDDGDSDIVQTKSVGTYFSIQSFNIRSQTEIHASKLLKLNLGIKAAHTIIKPFESGISTNMQEDEESFNSFKPLSFEELSSYAEAEVKATKKLFIKPGLHASVYQFKNYNTVVFQPRFYMAYRFLPSHAVYASYSKMSQFLHLVTNPYIGFNNDLWVPSTQLLKPEWSDIYNLGYSFRHNKTWKLLVDAYYKNLVNVTNYVEGKSSFINEENWEQNIETGKGRSYGAECMLERKGNTLSWKLAYALSWSWRQFESINDGKEFPYKYDRRHTLNFGSTLIITSSIDVSALWTFATGDVYTLPGRIYPEINNAQQNSSPDDPLNDYRFTYHYSSINQYRTKPYERCDASVSYHSKNDKKIYSSLTAGIYNINGSADQYTYTLLGSVGSKSITIKTRNSIFKLMPYLSYSLKF